MQVDFLLPRVLLVLSVASTVCGQGLAQEVEGQKLLAPRSFGFDFEPAYSTEVADQVVSVRDEQGERVNARLYCRGGDEFGIVLMPDGVMRSYRIDDMQLVEKKYKPMRHLVIGKRLRADDSGRFRGFKIKKTKHYLYVYNTRQSFQDVTGRILETMNRGLTLKLKKDGFDIHAPDVPLVVIMFANKAQFQEFRPMPEGVVAYYNMVTNHIVLYEPTSSRGSRSVAQGQALSTIAHEGAHQILHNVGIQKRLTMWPMWLSEGLAEYYAPTSFRKGFRWKGAGEINDLRMFELENYVQSRELVGLDGSTLRDSISAARLDSTGYAMAWLVVHYLAEKHPKKLTAYIKYLSQLGPLEGMASHGDSIEENLDHFKKFFADDLEAEEAKLIEHLKAQKYESPVAGAPHFVTTVIYRDGNRQVKRGCIYHRKSLAQQWRRVFLDSLTPAQQATVKYHSFDFGNRGLAANYLSNFLK